MARPSKQGDRVSVSVRLPEKLLKRAQRVAEERDTSVSFLTQKALMFYLDRLPPLEMTTTPKDDELLQPLNAADHASPSKTGAVGDGFDRTF